MAEATLTQSAAITLSDLLFTKLTPPRPRKSSVGREALIARRELLTLSLVQESTPGNSEAFLKDGFYFDRAAKRRSAAL